ncbi:hypothetical protein GU926_12575 [Nibribacter ruber]|uniref:Uncharacterized protein n=1 Tax=Nibribacter ruber TaxID=2698458 RepID=A0A6P1P171_9BACT|nr:hypothetical protein [Nibribacter ruber]QHL88221.1 hypothetical protein GU926_12575 [Nibribacter ruber]
MTISEIKIVYPFRDIPSTALQPFTGLVAASHHASLRDVLNGYCLFFFTSPKDFNK